MVWVVSFSLLVSTIPRLIKHDTQVSIGLEDPEKVPHVSTVYPYFFWLQTTTSKKAANICGGGVGGSEMLTHSE